MLRPQEPTQGLTIGSLPFANLSGDPELETLAHALSGSLDDALSTGAMGFAYRRGSSVRFPAEWEGGVSDAERKRIEGEVTEHITRSLTAARETLSRPDPKPFVP